MSDSGTSFRDDKTNVTATQLATLSQAWLSLPHELRGAILLMVQPWVKSGLNMPRFANVAQSADDFPIQTGEVDRDELSDRASVRADQ